jgi:polar amino acid transport system substrate-binding protein
MRKVSQPTSSPSQQPVASSDACKSVKRTYTRMRWALACAALSALPVWGFAGDNKSGCERVVVTGDPDYPPFSWYENGKFYGSAIEIVTAALKRIGLPYEVRYVGPFLRALNEARAGSVDIIAELKDNADRRAYLAFSKVPIFANPVAVFTRADRKLPFKEWGDLTGLRGGVTLGNKFGGGFDEYLAAQLTVETADRIKQNFDKLAYARIDYFVNSYYPALTYLVRANREAEFTALQPFVTASDNFVGWSRASACVGRLEQFDAALTAMVRSGEVRRIQDENFEKLRQGSRAK